MHRFNRLYVYLPLGVVIATAVIILTLFLVGIFAPGLTGAAEFASALADVTIILFSIPMMLLCALGPALLIGLVTFNRKRRQQGIPHMEDGGRLQVLFWKLDLFIQQAQTKTIETAPKVADPIIKAAAQWAYLGAFLKKLRSYLKRS